MKRINLVLALVALIVFLGSSMARADGGRIYVLNLSIDDHVYTNGSSPYAGVSPFGIGYPNILGLPTSGTYIDVAKLKPGSAVFNFQLTGVVPYYATTITGVTVEVTYRSSNDGTTWSSATRILSGTYSTYLNEVVTWIPEPAPYYKIELSGETEFQSATAMVACGLDTAKVLPIVVKEGTFTMPATATGVSQFIVGSIGVLPDGVNYGEFEVLSGTSAYYTTNGDTPAAATAFRLYMATTLSLSKEEARSVKWIPGATDTVIRYKLLNREP